MDNVDTKITKRLKHCFAATFPDVPVTEIESSDTNNTFGWDSMKTWTLLMVVQQEFGIIIGLDQISKLTSFNVFQNYISKKLTDRPLQ